MRSRNFVLVGFIMGMGYHLWIKPKVLPALMKAWVKKDFLAGLERSCKGEEACLLAVKAHFPACYAANSAPREPASAENWNPLFHGTVACIEDKAGQKFFQPPAP